MNVLSRLLCGKRTYIVGSLMVLAAGAYHQGYITEQTFKALEALLVGTGLVTLRLGIARIGKVALLLAAFTGCVSTPAYISCTGKGTITTRAQVLVYAGEATTQLDCGDGLIYQHRKYAPPPAPAPTKAETR